MSILTGPTCLWLQENACKMKIVSYNIQYGLGQDNRYDLSRIVDEVRPADVIVLQEVERFWQRSGCVDQVEALADGLPDHDFIYGANMDMDASERSVDGRLQNRRRRQFGNMVLSRFPILSTRNFPLPKRGLIRQHSVQKGLLETVIALPGGPVRVYCTHLCHLCAETRLPQIETIKRVIENAPAEGGAWCGDHPNREAGWIEQPAPPMPVPFMLMGDMNFTNQSAEYAALVGPVATGYGRLVNPASFVDAWCAAGHDENEGKSRETGRIDHCFVSHDIAQRIQSARFNTDCIASDHFPFWIEMEG